jgi:hypothetical protein
VLRRIFGPKRGEVMGECRKLHDRDLNNLYSSPDQIMENEVGGTGDWLQGCGMVSLSSR